MWVMNVTGSKDHSENKGFLATAWHCSSSFECLTLLTWLRLSYDHTIRRWSSQRSNKGVFSPCWKVGPVLAAYSKTWFDINRSNLLRPLLVLRSSVRFYFFHFNGGFACDDSDNVVCFLLVVGIRLREILSTHLFGFELKL